MSKIYSMARRVQILKKDTNEELYNEVITCLIRADLLDQYINSTFEAQAWRQIAAQIDIPLATLNEEDYDVIFYF